MRRLQTKCVCLLLTLATLAVPQALLADTEWKVESTTEGTKTTFTVTRSGDVSETVDVYYRTISISAMAVYNYQARSGKWQFTPGETSKSVTVSELTASYDAFKYQVGAKRRYGFEVTDWEGVRLAYCERAMSTGSAIPADAFNEKHVDVITSQVTVTDGGYKQAYHAVNLNKFFTADGQRDYYTYTGAEVYMTVSMNVSEKNDGYQYIAVMVNNTDGYDMNAGSGRPYNTDATVGYISMRASYMAGFGHNPGSQSGSAASYSFPVRDPKGNITGGVEKPWSSLGNSVGKLYTQFFKDGYEASDGRILLPTDISTLGLRFDASGNNGDTWYAANVKANLQASEGSVPKSFGQGHMDVSGGPYYAGCKVYISLPFREIVMVNGTPSIQTTWGTMEYMDGAGSNVLTFGGEIVGDVGSELSVTKIEGDIADLAGNKLSGSTACHSSLKIEQKNWEGSGTSEHPYRIKKQGDLERLASRVNGGETFANTFFIMTEDIRYSYRKEWNDCFLNGEESGIVHPPQDVNNHTPIGDYYYAFSGNFDGKGHVISGIRIEKIMIGMIGKCNGLFGNVAGGVISNITFEDACIYSSDYTGSIVGTIAAGGTVSGCRVKENVVIINTNGGCCYGGIVGLCKSGCKIEDCISSVKDGHLIDNDKEWRNWGNIVGYTEGSNSLSRNYYYDTNYGGGVDGSDRDGARRVQRISLAEGISASGESVVVDGIRRYACGTEIMLDYAAPEGYSAEFIVDGQAIEGTKFTMPRKDIAVTVNLTKNVLELADDGDNAEKISSAVSGGKVYEIALSGRTIFKDGCWNTLCLPFSLSASAIPGSPLAGGTLMELDAAGSVLDETGILTLKFVPADHIEAGKPYIIQWSKAADYTTDGTHDVQSPRFEGVTVRAAEAGEVTFSGGSFAGQFSKIDVKDEDANKIIQLAGGDQLGYSSAGSVLHACRAHFYIPVGGSNVKAYQLDFGGGETSIVRIKEGSVDSRGEWYDISGRRLDGEPKVKGIYIRGGQKVVVK